MNHHPFRLGIAGWKNSGKTTLLGALVGELITRGYRVATVKHAHHRFDIDHEGTDSYHHRKSGAQQTAIVSANRWAIMRETTDSNVDEPTLDDIILKLDPCDIVLIEGYKTAGHPKIEAVNPDKSDRAPLFQTDATIIAVACRGEACECTLPMFDTTHSSHIPALADFVEAHYDLRKAS